jgi:hypothetical protein
MTQIGHIEQVGFLSYNKIEYDSVKLLYPSLPQAMVVLHLP